MDHLFESTILNSRTFIEHLILFYIIFSMWSWDGTSEWYLHALHERLLQLEL